MTHPDFICLGAQKTGTQWVYDQFGAHRDFWKHPLKEVAFFDNGVGPARVAEAKHRLQWMEQAPENHVVLSRQYASPLRQFARRILLKPKQERPVEIDYSHETEFLKGIVSGGFKPWNGDFATYFALFDNKPGKGFDCTPGYCRLDRGMAGRMVAAMPRTRFFLTVRDPADRLWSQAQMHVRLKRDRYATGSLEGFKAFATSEPTAALSFLSKTIHAWRAIDRDNRFRVFSFDELRRNPEEYRQSLAEFTGADPDGFTLDAGFNRKVVQPGKSAMPDRFRKWAARYFRAEYTELENLMGGDAAAWRKNNQTYLS